MSIGARLAITLIGLGVLAGPGPATAQTAHAVAGTWDATVDVQGAQIPFRLGLSERSGLVRATFFDGARPTNPSAPTRLAGDQLDLTFPSYAAELKLTLAGSELDGTYTRGHNVFPIHAVREGPKPPADGRAPSIAGQWIIPKPSAKGEQAWRLIVRQSGSAVQATILRVDGDTGTLDGRYAGGVFRVSHFAGERPALMVIKPGAGNRLSLSLDDGDGHADLVALRPHDAQAQGIAPSDPTQFTRVADPAAPFAFDFPDLSGHKVANTDRRFRGKVVVVDVMGSWCPNCHDEAPFLQALYAKRHAQGLEVVALDFEQADQLADPQRLKAFVQRYGITYTVLLAGEPKDVHDKLPQAVNLAAWPTTFFLGRDGRVKAVHVGFTSPGSGPLDVQTRAGVEREVDKLLAGRAGRS